MPLNPMYILYLDLLVGSRLIIHLSEAWFDLLQLSMNLLPALAVKARGKIRFVDVTVEATAASKMTWVFLCPKRIFINNITLE